MEDNKLRDEVIDQITENVEDVTEVVDTVDDSVKRGAILAVGLLGVGMALGVAATKGVQKIGQHLAEKKRLKNLRTKTENTAEENTSEEFEDADFVEVESEG